MYNCKLPKTYSDFHKTAIVFNTNIAEVMHVCTLFIKEHYKEKFGYTAEFHSYLFNTLQRKKTINAPIFIMAIVSTNNKDNEISWQIDNEYNNEWANELWLVQKPNHGPFIMDMSKLNIGWQDYNFIEKLRRYLIISVDLEKRQMLENVLIKLKETKTETKSAVKE